MVVTDVAHLVPHDVGVYVFVGEKDIAEEGERALVATCEHRRAAAHLALGRADDERDEFSQLEEKQQRHYADTY